MSEPEAPTGRFATLKNRVEDSFAGVLLAAMVAIPLIEVLGRATIGRGLTGSAPLVQHLCLWVAFLGAALAAREDKLLRMATGELLGKGAWGRAAASLSGFVACAICVLLAAGAWELVVIEREAETVFGPQIPVWVAQAVLPFAFALIGLRIALRAPGWIARSTSAGGLVLGALLASRTELFEEAPSWPGLVAVLAATLLGGPLFAAIGGAAVLLFLAEGIPGAIVSAEAYRMAVQPHLPALPLFTLTGFLLAEGDCAERLLRLFRALVGWIPGGTAVVCALLCAFLTVFTGGSGVTILVLGGLLFQALRADGYGDRFSLGLLTASGSLGLLWPPALPLILYGIVAEVPIPDLFLGGLVPGLLLVGLVAAWGVRQGLVQGAVRVPFSAAEARAALWGAKFEVLLPVVVVGLVFSGTATLVEAAAATAAYAFFVQTLVHKTLRRASELLRVLRECIALIGGVLLILGVSIGLTGYLVDAEVPAQLIEWAKENVESRWAFLLGLNVFLLAVGCLMDVFSATVVVVPLIVPMGEAFGVDPIHLGIIFIANLELGYLTPPVGLNLFLASYRFERPLLDVYRAALPMLLILGIGVLLITYLPVLTTGLVAWVGSGGG